LVTKPHLTLSSAVGHEATPHTQLSSWSQSHTWHSAPHRCSRFACLAPHYHKGHCATSQVTFQGQFVFFL